MIQEKTKSFCVEITVLSLLLWCPLVEENPADQETGNSLGICRLEAKCVASFRQLLRLELFGMKVHFSYIDLVLWPSDKGTVRSSVEQASLCFLWVLNIQYSSCAQSSSYPKMYKIRSQRKSEIPNSWDLTHICAYLFHI